MNDKNKIDEKQMMSEEYGREFGGCLWLCIAILIGIAITCCIILFT